MLIEGKEKYNLLKISRVLLEHQQRNFKSMLQRTPLFLYFANIRDINTRNKRSAISRSRQFLVPINNFCVNFLLFLVLIIYLIFDLYSRY